ncbi:hypothetical protein TBLA_0A04040 [Henningerozyma blattae CBS 6284]|uniref:ENTH domain-containing protein n=1 Tax=Henningerozyma blattae (strain ATCC 34711 / CBS 6284 / DSM 70876 / NBRC 10599 / NRRL Y-10934 / UCD 77-7) TaxID=1071380 RepID=I2GVP8_HENB6|nr:hypothetical protein TBLA_0A04040 [Tetrapisispora blattae CBS 6284]CCH58200.1 hypothetical protein TBLA_0A04040 [Tetrapisispora blattae CBS 6284]
MDSLSKKIQNLGIHDIRNAARFAQNVIVQYEPYQIDIRRATNTDAWGPTSKHLAKVLRNRYQVPLYLMTEYILKRIVDHIAVRPKNFYEKARKDYVNYGAEWRVVLKCLVVIDFLFLNVEEGEELNQVKSCMLTHKHILTSQVASYKIPFSNDGKMEIHERGIRKKSELILQYMDDPRFLREERIKSRKNANKIHRQQQQSFTPSNDVIFNANAMDDMNDMDFDIEDIAMQNEVRQQHIKTPSNVDEQRRQRREILRERIKSTELQRKQQIQKNKASTSSSPDPVSAPQTSASVPDLLDLDFDSAPAPSSKLPKASINNNINDDDDDDDDFGDFQSESATGGKPAVKTVSAPPVIPSEFTTTNTSALDDLLDLGSSSANNKSTTTATAISSNTQNNSAKKDDAFDDLFNFSKSLI